MVVTKFVTWVQWKNTKLKLILTWNQFNTCGSTEIHLNTSYLCYSLFATFFATFFRRAVTWFDIVVICKVTQQSRLFPFREIFLEKRFAFLYQYTSNNFLSLPFFLMFPLNFRGLQHLQNRTYFQCTITNKVYTFFMCSKQNECEF